MDIKRVLLFGALAFVTFSLWNNWQIEHPSLNKTPATEVSEKVAQNVATSMLPKMEDSASMQSSLYPNNVKTEQSSNTNKGVIKVETDVLSLVIEPIQGNIIKTNLLNYPESVTAKNKPFSLLDDNENSKYFANSNLFTVQNQQINNLDFNYTSSTPNYSLTEGNDTLSVNLTAELNDGLIVTKTYNFKRGSYLIDVDYKITNNSGATWTGYLNTQLFRSSPKETKGSMMQLGSYTGASYSVPGETRYKKISFKDMKKHELDIESQGGWIAMQQHYFLTAWIPNSDSQNRFYTRASQQDYTIGNVSKAINVEPNKTKTISAKLYLGPEITETLKEISPGLDLTVDYGWLWFISQLLFSLMKAIYNFVGNWGVAIILVTVLIKLAFYRLSAKSYKSMAGMRKLQPKIQSIRERYGDDKAKMSQATMELYRKEKVNPLGGCLPIIIQIPVFIALYWVLVESVELRQADFMFWINDLSSPDRYHVLPIIMGLTMLIQQKLNPAPPDPMQAKVMMFLPVVFTILFLNFPAGLVLYWTINNSLSILQQWYITRKYGEKADVKKLASVK